MPVICSWIVWAWLKIKENILLIWKNRLRTIHHLQPQANFCFVEKLISKQGSSYKKLQKSPGSASCWTQAFSPCRCLVLCTFSKLIPLCSCAFFGWIRGFSKRPVFRKRKWEDVWQSRGAFLQKNASPIWSAHEEAASITGEYGACLVMNDSW